MTRKTSATLIDNAIILMHEGITLREIAKRVGVGIRTIAGFIRARGVIIPPSAGKYPKQLPDNQIIADYESGISELELSKKYGIARTGIRPRLIKAGVHIRNGSEANLVSASRTTFENRQQRCKAANDALRGRKQPKHGRVKSSIGRELSCNPTFFGTGENEFAELLTERGIKFTRQKSVDRYSLDFAIRHVAVELKFRNPGCRMRGDELRNRLEKLLECGYCTLYVCFNSIEDLRGNADYIIAHINRLNRKPPARRKYWVIRSRFEKFTRCRDKHGQFACIPTTPELFASIREFDC